MFGQGILKGLKITFGYLFKPPVTQAYPYVKPALFPRIRSSLSLNPEKCIACGLCANACPPQVISLTSTKDEKNKKVLQSYKMKIGYCLYCGLCTETCPTKALTVSQEFENAVFEAQDLIWDMIERSKRMVR